MRVLAALDSFKGSLTSTVACRIVAETVRKQCPGWECDVLPMADGGEGTLEALTSCSGGETKRVPGVIGPLPWMRVEGAVGWIPEQKQAIVEMAQASGLPYLSPEQRNPMITTTYGTGQLIAAADAIGAEEILLTLGGSATVDGGTGAARALGWRFLDRHGRCVPSGGGSLRWIATLAPPASPCKAKITALCDVTNPLCGSQGAASVYGPQKGATPEMVKELEAGLAHLATLIEEQLGVSVEHIPGAGAAGGFGAGAVAFLSASLEPGISAVARVTRLEQHLADVDWVITGEGCFDTQSLQGKVVSGVLDMAQAQNVRTAVVAGSLGISAECWEKAGISLAEACRLPGMSLESALASAEDLLASAVKRLLVKIHNQM